MLGQVDKLKSREYDVSASMFNNKKGALAALILFALFSSLLTTKSVSAESWSGLSNLKTVEIIPDYTALGSGDASTLLLTHLVDMPSIGVPVESKDTHIPEVQVDSALNSTLNIPVNPSDTPVRIVIPSVKIDSPILGMGINNKGELDVPSGKTNVVGWYKYGIVPGLQGSAVLDAHVFAAFENLKNLKNGSDVYIITTSGKKLHFVVNTTKTYALGNLSPVTLFGLNDAKRLNLVTCAGNLTPDGSTYDHRLVVYTTFKGVVSA
ncbi:class F sortase [Candidatus Parcubacteria bacterium]|nr:class F sortase [Candidatus Parcubacteria bacterium]